MIERAMVPSWKIKGLAHGFFTRKGGVSQGLWQGANMGLGSQDKPEDILKNRALAMESLVADLPNQSPPSLYTLYQHHSPDAVLIDGKSPPAEIAKIKADGLVAKQQGIAIGILTADCVPVLFHDPQNRVIGAAHAGWRGALYGVLDNVLALMIDQGAALEHCQAAIGPAIQQPSYEVGLSLFQEFTDHDESAARFFVRGARDGHFQFDLVGYVHARLLALGLGSDHIFNLGADTYSAPDDYYSYRRCCHKGEADYGRQLSAISLIFPV